MFNEEILKLFLQKVQRFVYYVEQFISQHW